MATFIKGTLFLIIMTFTSLRTDAHVRNKVRLWDNWRFVQEHVEGAELPSYDDRNWKVVSLPHDAAISGPFLKSGKGATSRNGFRPLNRGWYRRHLPYDPSWKGKRVIIEFEGVYRDAHVFINGKPCNDSHPNGYLDFEEDITDFLVEGDNIIAVSYDNRFNKSSRWYNGEGINRDVWLKIIDPLHVARYGTYITTPKITKEQATVIIETQVENQYADSVICRLETEIISPTGQTDSQKVAVAPFASHETYTYRQKLTVDSPQLWNIGDGKLYRAISRVYLGSKLTDEYETTFGIREIEMSPDSGLIVNGHRVYVNGVCLHADLGPLGTASFTAAWDRRLRVTTEELGCNAIRLAHNVFPRYVLDWADRHGILIFDEMLDKWEESFYGKGAQWGKRMENDMKIWLKRDRNHPSVFIWSVGNEVYQQIEWSKTKKGGVEKLKMLVDIVHNSDPSRPVTVGQYPNRFGSVNRHLPEAFAKAEPHPFEFYTDVVSTNYLERYWDRDHKKYPQLIFLESEMAVGNLGYDYFNFDHSYPVGQFYWGGTDYIGESFGWPSKGWVRGLVDITNHLKPLGWSVRSFYNSKPMVKIVVRPDRGQGYIDWNDVRMTWIPLETQWNYSDSDTLKVQVMSNCEETELFLNDVSLGRKVLPEKDTPPELVWQVPYKQGRLIAIGYNNNQPICRDTIMTSGRPAKISLHADVNSLEADGMDLAYINCSVLDKNGFITNDRVEIEFTVEGEGCLQALASDDMMSNEPWQGSKRRTTNNGHCQLIVRSASKEGHVNITAKSKGLKSVKIKIPVIKTKNN